MRLLALNEDPFAAGPDGSAGTLRVGRRLDSQRWAESPVAVAVEDAERRTTLLVGG